MALLIGATSTSYAQYEGDAGRFSIGNNAGDARIDAIGGQKAAIGGNISTIYGNPAGLGMFSKSEFSISPRLNFGSNKIGAFGTSEKQSNNNLDLDNVGVVFHTRTYTAGDTKKGLISLNFGIGYQRTGAYRDKFGFSGETNLNGLGDYFAQESNFDLEGGATVDPSDLLSDVHYQAYQAYLTDWDGTDYFPITSTNSEQQYNIRRTGGSSEVDFSLGMNFSNKLFFGVGLGLANLNYTSTESVNESGISQEPGNTQTTDYNVTYNRNFDTEGSGVNLKLGAILKPTPELQIGLALQTPTWYSITDNYSESLLNNLNAAVGSKQYPYEYELRTPLKINGGIAYFIGSKGFISADVGFTDYSKNKITSNNASIDQTTNMRIKNIYANAVNYSVGGEYKIDKSWLVRAGFRSDGNPYKNLRDKDYTVNSISGGVGYRFGDYHLDAALINSNGYFNYSNYLLVSGNPEPQASVDKRINRLMLTFGVRF